MISFNILQSKPLNSRDLIRLRITIRNTDYNKNEFVPHVQFWSCLVREIVRCSRFFNTLHSSLHTSKIQNWSTFLSQFCKERLPLTFISQDKTWNRGQKCKQKRVGVDGETQWPFSPVQKHFKTSLMQSLENDHRQCRKVVCSSYLHFI